MCTTGNMDLFMACIPHYLIPNYARWKQKYHDNLLKPFDSNPEVYKEWKNHLIRIKRTNKFFSDSQILLTLEQNINDDATNKRIGATKRWDNTYFIRLSVVSEVLDEPVSTKKEQVPSDLKKHSTTRLQDKGKKFKINYCFHGNSENVVCLLTCKIYA